MVNSNNNTTYDLFDNFDKQFIRGKKIVIPEKYKTDHEHLRTEHKLLLSTIVYHCIDKKIPVRLRSKYLKRNIGNNYNEIISDLENWGYITRDHSYKVGIKSKKIYAKQKALDYKFPKNFYNSIELKQYVNNIKIEFENNYSNPLAVKNQRTTLQMLKDGLFSISTEDLNTVLYYYKNDSDQLNREYQVYLIDDNQEEELIKKSFTEWKEYKLKSCLDVYNCILNRESYYAYDKDTEGRIYNIFTNMPKKLRYLLKLDGYHCKEYDLKNAQFLFLAINIISSSKKYQKSHSVLRFLKYCVQGTLVKNISEQLELDQATVKNMLMNYLFVRSGAHDVTPHLKRIDDHFKANFRDVHQYLKENNHHNQISPICRTYEAEWCHRTIDQIREINLLAYSVHDAIQVPENIEEIIINKIIKNSINPIKINGREVKITPKFGIKSYKDKIKELLPPVNHRDGEPMSQINSPMIPSDSNVKCNKLILKSNKTNIKTLNRFKFFNLSNVDTKHHTGEPVYSIIKKSEILGYKPPKIINSLNFD